MPPRFARAPGLLVEPMGDMWVAYSPLSGETLVLNDESAAIAEVLQSAPGDMASVCATLAADLGQDVQELMPKIAPHWVQLVEAGLVTPLPDPAQ